MLNGECFSQLSKPVALMPDCLLTFPGDSLQTPVPRPTPLESIGLDGVQALVFFQVPQASLMDCLS